MEGQGNPRMATQGAKLLGAMAGPEDLAALAEAYQNGDALTQRLVIRIMGSLEDPGASVWLMLLAATAREDFLDTSCSRRA